MSIDRIRLNASRSLDPTSAAESIPRGTIEPERLREIVRQLATDFYESAAVRRLVATRVQPDL